MCHESYMSDKTGECEVWIEMWEHFGACQMEGKNVQLYVIKNNERVVVVLI